VGQDAVSRFETKVQGITGLKGDIVIQSLAFGGNRKNSQGLWGIQIALQGGIILHPG
jgi:hypothetical protein